MRTAETRTRGSFRWIGTVVLITVSVAAGFFIHDEIQAAHRKELSQDAQRLLTDTSEAFAEVAAMVQPSVVSIVTSKTVTGGPQGMNPLFSDPFFRRFFGDRFGDGHDFGRSERKEQGLGSGVIVDEAGYILTNNHVIDKADDIKVVLSDKREFEAKLIGTDPKTDLAVVKIDGKDLDSLALGDSDKLKVGELVFAIGSPFRLNFTVTMGIVSAKGRANVGIADYEDFIQTDAAINPGNSGGAMVNSRGELVGINTAIFSTTGGYQGIGFAIPSNMAKVVMDQLLSSGKVTRGWLGVSIQGLTRELASQFGLKDERGALVSGVIEGSAAEKAGLKRGDVIVEFNGQDVFDPTGLRNMVAGTPPGTGVKIGIIREGRSRTLEARLDELEGEQVSAGPDPDRGRDNVLRGVQVEEITGALRGRLRLPDGVEGVIVSEVDEDSPARSMLQPGDIIMELNRQMVQGIRDYEEIISGVGEDDAVLILVYRNGGTFYLSITRK